LLGVVEVDAVALADVVERRVAVDSLVGGGDAVMADADGEMQAVSVVVDVAQQRVAGVLGVIEVQARVEGHQVVQRPGVVQVVVVLVPDVLQFGRVQVAGQAFDAAPGHAGPVKVLAFIAFGECAVGGADALVAALVVRFGEAGLAALDHPAVEAVVGQADTTKRLRQHAAFTAGDHRVGEKQVTGLQLGIERTHFQSTAGRGERTRRFAVAIADRQDAGVVRAATAVEFQTEHGVGIEAEADRAFGVARLEFAEETLAPLDVVVRVLQAVAIHVVVAGVEVEAGAFDEAFFLGFGGVGSGGNRCGNCNEQRGETGWVTHLR